MGKFISVYTGMNYTLEQNKDYIALAKSMGYKGIFTSFNISEASGKKSFEDFKKISDFCQSLSMSIAVDISPEALKKLNVLKDDLKIIKDLGITTMRVDFGFTAEDISDFTKNKYNLKIEINASTVSEKFLYDLSKFNPCYRNLKACHNFYPRLNTGLSLASFIKKNKWLKSFGIEVSAFIPSLSGKREPFHEGLPTLEIHRLMEPKASAKHLYLMGIDNVIFGDAFASTEELKNVSELHEDYLDLNVMKFNPTKEEEKIIFDMIHENRQDAAEDVVRSQTSRIELPKNIKIEPHDNIPRERGFITIDNKNYLRYNGELQICKKTLPADSRVNVVAKLEEDEFFLLDYIDEETKFKFTL